MTALKLEGRYRVVSKPGNISNHPPPAPKKNLLGRSPKASCQLSATTRVGRCRVVSRRLTGGGDLPPSPRCTNHLRRYTTHRITQLDKPGVRVLRPKLTSPSCAAHYAFRLPHPVAEAGGCPRGRPVSIRLVNCENLSPFHTKLVCNALKTIPVVFAAFSCLCCTTATHIGQRSKHNDAGSLGVKRPSGTHSQSSHSQILRHMCVIFLWESRTPKKFPWIFAYFFRKSQVFLFFVFTKVPIA